MKTRITETLYRVLADSLVDATTPDCNSYREAAVRLMAKVDLVLKFPATLDLQEDEARELLSVCDLDEDRLAQNPEDYGQLISVRRKAKELRELLLKPK